MNKKEIKWFILVSLATQLVTQPFYKMTNIELILGIQNNIAYIFPITISGAGGDPGNLTQLFISHFSNGLLQQQPHVYIYFVVNKQIFISTV